MPEGKKPAEDLYSAKTHLHQPVPEVSTVNATALPADAPEGACLLYTSLYPCGEGAGYAGGIMSAAVDGLRVARAIIGRYAPAEG